MAPHRSSQFSVSPGIVQKVGSCLISYCIASFRPKYSRLLIEDLLRKTTAPFEILLWLNLDDAEYESFLGEQIAHGCPIRVIGKTPENIGMQAYPLLFDEAQSELLVQIDDDVIAISRNIAEQAHEIFRAFPRVKQLVADVWQDEFTTGARPPMTSYRPYNVEHGLYDGPMDGWFSVFHRSVLPLVERGGSPYLPLGELLKNRFASTGQSGFAVYEV